MKRQLIYALGAALAIALTGCSDDSAPKPKAFEPIPVSRSEEAIIDADNGFAYELFDAVGEHVTEHSNYVVSPLSVSITLAMAANGASGETLDEMLDVLGFGKGDIADVNAFYKKMLERLPGLDNTMTVNIANALWINKDFTATTYDAFSSNITGCYYSPITFLHNFGSDATRKSINQWYSDNTRGMLSGPTLSDLNAETALVFTNALYFKGFWKETFKKGDTRKRNFTNSDGTVSRVQTMHKTAGYSGYADDGYRAVSFPYGNTEYSMIIVLPEKGVSLDDCLATLNRDDVSRLAKDGYDFGKQQLMVQLPIFDVSTESGMIPALNDMGIKKMFESGKADFSGICGHDMFVSRINHGVRIVVDETGAEAVSYTVGKGELTSPGHIIDGEFIVDRPFVFIIAEKSTGLPLFMGRINKL